ncbi:hypothetical protein ACERK3_09365 [Phycisphaerales bacterium AB-hyl4]|uniref:Uncharacterized protein n=1 Tax=Natronomicrosphaera hydrolytica TaxID=3242702 RepID=A0ABV4U6C6_9BACT
MGWTDLPVDYGYDVARPDFLNQFVEAINERRALRRTDLLAPFEEGDRLSATRIAQLQNACVLMVNESAWWDWDAYPNPMALDQTPIDELSESDVRLTLTRVRELAELPPEGFTRKRPKLVGPGDSGAIGDRAYGTSSLRNGLPPRTKFEYDGGWVVSDDQWSAVDIVTEHGIAQVGDYLGPWLFNEMQVFLQQIKWIRPDTIPDFAPFWTVSSEKLRNEQSVTGGGSSTDLSALLADAKSEWGSASPVSIGSLSGSEQIRLELGRNRNSQWVATAASASFLCDAESNPSSPIHELRCHAFFLMQVRGLPSATYVNFDATPLGLGSGYEHTYWFQDLGEGGFDDISLDVDGHTLPADPVIPDASSNDRSRSGCVIAAGFGGSVRNAFVMQFDVEGGFEYL